MTKIWYAPHQKEAYGEKEINAVVACLQDGWLAGFGPKTIQFEQEIATLFGKQYGLFVNSGSSAILLGLQCLQLQPGDEIITPACTFATTVAPILQCGLTPIFCDVEIGTYVPSVEQIMAKITKQTKVILLPNLIGSKPDWTTLRQRISELDTEYQHIILFEDSADTITYTKETDISITSFYSSHLITAAGSGGMLLVNDKTQLQYATMYRDWGRIGDNDETISKRFEYQIDGIPYDYKFLYGVIGYNFKSSEINAAFGLIQLQRLEEIKQKRKMNFERYIEQLQNIPEILLPINTYNTDWLAFALMSPYRMPLLQYLESQDIQTRVCFAGNITRHPAYRSYFESFPNSDQIMEQGFLLGAHHGMTIEDVDYVCEKIKFFFHSKNNVENV
jgi:CDP-4-dehydro-6-deoxyglucose reductase, E1